MNLLPNLKDKEDAQLAFPMGNWNPKANRSFPSLNTQIYCYNKCPVREPPFFQILNAEIVPAWANFLVSYEQCLGLGNSAWLCPLQLGLAAHGPLANWVVPWAVLSPRVRQLLPFLLWGVLCATLSRQELQWKIPLAGLHGTAGWQQGWHSKECGAAGEKWEELQCNV